MVERDLPQQIHIGCSGWQYRHWGAIFYPAELPSSRWLGHYARTFDTVEITNSFYRLPPPETFAKWREHAARLRSPQATWLHARHAPRIGERTDVFAYSNNDTGATRRATRFGCPTAFTSGSVQQIVRAVRAVRAVRVVQFVRRSPVQFREMAAAHLALTPEIEMFRAQFEHLATDADALVGPLSDAQFRWRPSPQSWSISDCIEHLNTVARLYLPSLDEGIADAIRRGLYAEGPFRYNWIGRIFVRLMEPPPAWRLRTPQAFVPPAPRSRAEITAAFRAYQVQFVDRLRQANGLDLARARATSPASRWIRLPLGSAFAAVTAHERRHLWQARKVMEADGFPG